MHRVECWGTFDVANYGDLLFPAIFEDELRRRIPGLRLRLRSPRGAPATTFLPAVDRISRHHEAEPPASATPLAVVVGGGDIIRCDDSGLAEPYGISPAQARRERCFRAFLEAAAVVPWPAPVLWNAVGVPHDFAGREAALVRTCVRRVDYLSVRDDTSRRRLQEAGVEAAVHVVPDTAFALDRLLPRSRLAPVHEALVRAGRLPPPGYVCLHLGPPAAGHLAAMRGVLRKFRERHPAIRLVLLPIGACHGDVELLRRVRDDARLDATLADPGDPVETAAVIAHASLFAGTSLHGNITAYVYGVPHLFLSFTGLTKLRGAAAWMGARTKAAASPEEAEAALEALLGTPPHREGAAAIARALDAHFDRCAELIDRARHADESRGRHLPPAEDVLHLSGRLDASSFRLLRAARRVAARLREC